MIPTIVNQGGGKWAFEKLTNILNTYFHSPCNVKGALNSRVMNYHP
jgi:hypothetical protein